jgi:hypothetical protein
MSNHNGFQIIADSAGCAVVRLNSPTVTVRHLKGFLCLGEPPLEFLHNVADRMTESHETAIWGRPVAEVAYLTD